MKYASPQDIMKQYAPPLETIQEATTSAKATARRVHHNFQRAHGRVLRVQTVAAEDPNRFLASVLLPPVGVYYELGFAPDIAVNVLLTLLGFIPGVLHVLYIMTSD